MSRWRFAIIIFSCYFALLLVGRWVKCGYNRSDLLFLSFLLACVFFSSFKCEIDNSNTMGWTSSSSCIVSATTDRMLQSIRIFQNRVADSDQFWCTRARLNHGLWDIVEKDACPYHCATDGMLMALKRWNNTNNESKLNILIKNNSYKTNSYLHLLTRHSHNMRCAYKYVPSDFFSNVTFVTLI